MRIIDIALLILCEELCGMINRLDVRWWRDDKSPGVYPVLQFSGA